MIVKFFEKYMQDSGYIALPTKYPEITEYFKEENSCINIIQVVELKKDSTLTNEQYEQQKSDVINTITKLEPHIMNIVFYEDRLMAENLVSDDYMCWFIDKHSATLEVDDNRVEDFYGLKDELEKWLHDTVEILASGDMNAISQKLMNQQEKEVYEKKKKKKPSPVAVTLVVVNCIIFLTSIVIGDAFVESGELNSVLAIQGQYYRFLTATFLHGGVDHLFGNMILLYFMGEMVEHKTGSVKFGIIYFVSGILGNVVSFVYHMIINEEYISLGASGAVYGIIGALLYMVLVKTKGLNIPVKRMALMVVYCIYSSFATDHIDYAAHIGGLIIGFIVCALLYPKGGKARNEG